LDPSCRLHGFAKKRTFWKRRAVLPPFPP
jgi:hypothetical protein